MVEDTEPGRKTAEEWLMQELSKPEGEQNAVLIARFNQVIANTKRFNADLIKGQKQNRQAPTGWGQEPLLDDKGNIVGYTKKK